MRKSLIFLVAAGMLAACGADPKASGTSNAVSGNKNGVVLSKDGNSTIAAVPDQPLNGETSNRLTPNTRERMELQRQKNLITSNKPAPPPPPPQFHPAPEDSEVATTMTSDGSVLEVRVFKKNPQLAKVEMKWVDPKNKIFRIFLRNGKVVDATSDEINNLGSTPASVFVQMAAAGAVK